MQLSTMWKHDYVIETAYRNAPTHVETKTDRRVPQNIIKFNISFKKHSTYLDH